MKWPHEFKFWILKRFLVCVIGWCWWVCRCLGFESWACLGGFWKSGIFPYDKDSILNCPLNYAFECFWMITRWALILEREQVRPESLHTIVFRFCLICICKVFDEMAAWIQVLNFEKIFGMCDRLVLVSLQMLGFWKLSLFGWFLKKWDLPIW